MSINFLKSSSLLPIEYQEVEYIESTGTQYIDTGVFPNNNMEVSIDFNPMTSTNAQHRIMSVVYASGRFFYCGVSQSPYNLVFCSTYLTLTSTTTQNLGQRRKIKYNNNGIWDNGVLVTESTISPASFTSQYSIYLFANNNMGTVSFTTSAGSYRLYSLQIMKDNIIVRDFVPCYRKSDGEIGLYDLVNGVFYTNAGTGTFIKGNDVGGSGFTAEQESLVFIEDEILPVEYQRVEYIGVESDEPYIDLDITGDQNTKAEVTFSSSGDTQVCLFGYQANAVGITFNLSQTSNNTRFGAWVKTGWGSDMFDGNKHTVEISQLGLYQDGVLVDIPTSQTFTTGNLTLFKADGAVTYGNKTIYGCRVWNNNLLQRNMIPCYRKSDNEIGLYDLVNKQFYSNGGTGTFVKGPLVYLPTEYQQVEYIESTGTQYIDTGVSPNNNTGLKVVFSDLSVEGRDFNFIGCRLTGSSRFMINYTDGNFGYGWDSYYTTNENINISAKNTAELNFYNSRNFIANGNTLANLSTISISDMPTIYIFGQHVVNSNNLRAYKTYECEITQDNLLIRKFVPCYRKSDNVIGMYDTVNDVFYTNAGTGTFNKGNNVSYSTNKYKMVFLKKTDNLFDEISAYTKTGFTISNGEISTNYNYARHSFSQYGSNEFSLSESTTYYVSYKIKIACSNPSGNKSIWISFKNVGTGQNYAVTGFSVDNFDEWKTISFNQTLPAGSYQVALGAYGGSVSETYTTTLKDIMFDTKQITTYEPYGYKIIKI